MYRGNMIHRFENSVYGGGSDGKIVVGGVEVWLLLLLGR